MSNLVNKKRILVVYGTRPEAIKMVPVVLALRAEPSYEIAVCVTAQHRTMLDQVNDLFGITPNYDLNLLREGQSLTELSARLLSEIQKVINDYQPDLILVHGDTTTTFVTALAAFYERVKIGHVEAGLRTNDLRFPWPEEANRRLTDVVTDYYFAPTLQSQQNLLDEGVCSEKIFVTGNTVIDALKIADTIISNNSKRACEVTRPLPDINFDKKIILVTTHRRENIGKGIEEVCRAIKMLAHKFKDIEIIYCVHMNPKVKNSVHELLEQLENVHLLGPQDYFTFVYLMKMSYLILTDSGGIQEEAPAFGKPVLVLRDVTERPEAEQAGTIKLVGTRSGVIQTAVEELLLDEVAYTAMATRENPYGDGHAAERIVKAIKLSLVTG